MNKIILACLLTLTMVSVKAQIPGIDDTPHPRNAKPDTTKPSRTKIYNLVDIDKFPEFPGGLDGYNKFLAKNLRLPKGSEEIAGRIFLSFVIERDGWLSHIRIERSIGKDLDAEAIRVLKLSPRWTPGIKNGFPVRVKYLVPINIEISAGD